MKNLLEISLRIAHGILAAGSGYTFFDLESAADNALSIVKTKNPDLPPNELDTLKQTLVEDLIRAFSVWIGKDSTLFDNQGHVPWDPRSNPKQIYWNRYKAYISGKDGAAVAEALDDSTHAIMGYLEDGKRQGVWDRRGLVVGHVQSGKTANYTGLICKAADAGYKVIIVLTGMHNSLRAQTQIRLEEGFLGYDTLAAKDNDSHSPIGVGKLSPIDTTLIPNCVTSRSEKGGDISRKSFSNMHINPEQRPWLFVVKKNKRVLDELRKWLEKSPDIVIDTDKRKHIVGLPLLVVDDEADSASIDTGEQGFDENGKPDDDYAPKAINSAIRRILHLFDKKAYVGYTATPFANIFIHRKRSTPLEGPDLFPSSFILSLAAPSSYLGPAKMFGSSTPGSTPALPLTVHITDASDETENSWMPKAHNKEHTPLVYGQEKAPKSLEDAILSFILSCAAREARSNGGKVGHCSMLVHVTRFTDVQKKVKAQVDEFWKRVRDSLKGNIGATPWWDRLEDLWKKDFSVKTATILKDHPNLDPAIKIHTWDQIKAHILKVVGDLSSMEVNGSVKDVLEYKETAKKLKVIVIGGEKLARGLTLEGLSVSYFIRGTKLYDALMQMGRWFGYRPGYVDLCRLYTLKETIEWFEHISDAADELREEFKLMEQYGSRPDEYGLKVQAHPLLTATSKDKMRTAKSFKITFSGSLLETVAMHKSKDKLDQNLAATDQLFIDLGAPDEIDPKRIRQGASSTWKGFYWQKKPAKFIIDFLKSYASHPNARRVNSKLIAEFIKQATALETPALIDWNVAVIRGQQKAEYTFSQSKLQLSSYSVRTAENTDSDHLSIGRNLSGRDESIDMSEEEWLAALELHIKTETNLLAKGESKRKSTTPPIEPNGVSMRKVKGCGYAGDVSVPSRKEGLLLIYPLDPAALGLKDELAQAPVISFGISFPTDPNTPTATYTLDHLLLSEMYEPDIE